MEKIPIKQFQWQPDKTPIKEWDVVGQMLP